MHELLTLREHLSSPPVFLWGPCCSSFYFFCVALLYVFTFRVPCCHLRYDFRIITMFGSYLTPVVCGRLMSYLYYLCLLTYWCPTHIVLCFCSAFLCLVYHMLPVSLYCPLLIAPSIFSNVYLQVDWYIWLNFTSHRFIPTVLPLPMMSTCIGSRQRKVYWSFLDFSVSLVSLNTFHLLLAVGYLRSAESQQERRINNGKGKRVKGKRLCWMDGNYMSFSI